MLGNALDYLLEGAIIQLHKFNGNPIGLQLPQFVELTITRAEPGVRGDTSSGSVTKPATLETGLVIKVPLFVKEGEKVKVATETGEFSGRV
jgi:elongation factor P